MVKGCGSITAAPIMIITIIIISYSICLGIFILARLITANLGSLPATVSKGKGTSCWTMKCQNRSAPSAELRAQFEEIFKEHPSQQEKTPFSQRYRDKRQTILCLMQNLRYVPQYVNNKCSLCNAQWVHMSYIHTERDTRCNELKSPTKLLCGDLGLSIEENLMHQCRNTKVSLRSRAGFWLSVLLQKSYPAMYKANISVWLLTIRLIQLSMQLSYNGCPRWIKLCHLLIIHIVIGGVGELIPRMQRSFLSSKYVKLQCHLKNVRSISWKGMSLRMYLLFPSYFSAKATQLSKIHRYRSLQGAPIRFCQAKWCQQLKYQSTNLTSGRKAKSELTDSIKHCVCGQKNHKWGALYWQIQGSGKHS